MTRWMVAVLLVALARPATAQNEGRLHAAFDREREQLAESCSAFSLSKVGSCVYTLATATPVHATFGSIAPGNGFGVGPAFTWHHTPSENWRINWSGDGVRAPGGAWRAGAYANFVHTRVKAPVVVFGEEPLRPAAQDVYPVYSAYVQRISLPDLQFFGPPGDTSDAGLSRWTMQQTLTGGSALVPVGPGAVGLSLVGGIAARAIDAGGGSTDEDPGVETRYGSTLAPGIGDARTFLQLTAGVRMAPSLGARIRPLYQVAVDRFITGSDAHESFTRWSIDLLHELPLYRVTTGGRSTNTPNSCAVTPDDVSCPAPSRGRYGAVALRVHAVGSQVAEGNRVPFYLQPTIGGSDINGSRSLASYPDYFFRAPNILSLQASVEHSLVAMPLGHGFALPLGVFGMVEGGTARARFGDLFHGFERSYTAGLTIRAGSFPEVFLVYAWGGSRNHFAGTINPSLLGGGARPSLY